LPGWGGAAETTQNSNSTRATGSATGAWAVASWYAGSSSCYQPAMSWWPDRRWLRALDLGASTFTVKAPEHLRKLWARAQVPPGLAFLSGGVLGGLLVAVVTWREMPGLVGVLVGATISAAVASIVALEARRVQLAATTWARRLEAHQEAFSLWHKCWSVVHEEDQKKRNDTLNETTEWWLDNCLYLSEDARNAFVRMISSVRMHKIFLESKQDSEEWKSRIIENWDLITSTGQLIIKASYSHVSDDVIQGLGPPDPYGGREKPVR
jgi:hypothetical protein